MSTYTRLTKNPKTGEFENATWMDDYFGLHRYGVKFPDGSVVDSRIVELETMDTPMPNNTKKEECKECLSKGEVIKCSVCSPQSPLSTEKWGVIARKDFKQSDITTDGKQTKPYLQPAIREDDNNYEVVFTGGSPSSNEDWEKRLSNLGKLICECGIDDGECPRFNRIKDFIRQQRLEAFEEGKKQGRKECPHIVFGNTQ